MANSTGTASFTVTRDALSTASLRVLRVVDPEGGQTPTSTMLTNASQALNILLKNWQSQGLILSTYDQIAIPLTAGTPSYTIGPTGAAVTSVRPIRLFDGSFIRTTTAGVVTDTDLQIFSRQRYLQSLTKAVTGTTYGIYYWPGIDVAASTTNPGTGYGTLYVYFPSASNSTYTVYANFQRPIYDMTSAGDEFDLPQEWFRALKFGLAADMGYEYGVPDAFQQTLEVKAKMLKDELGQWNLDQANVAYGDDRARQERARDATTTKG